MPGFAFLTTAIVNVFVSNLRSPKFMILQKMTRSIPLLIIVAVVLGCNLFRGTTNTNSGPANTAPERAKKLVDIPSLIGKPLDEVKKELGEPAQKISDTIHKWKFDQGGPRGDLTLYCDYRKPSKVERIGFSMETIYAEGYAFSGFPTYDKLGDTVGIDVRGKTPKSSDESETGSVKFEKIDLNGKNVDEIEFKKMLGSFTEVVVTPVRGY